MTPNKKTQRRRATEQQMQTGRHPPSAEVPSLGRRVRMSPTLRCRPKRCLMLRPVVQCSRVKICPGRPNQCMNLGVKLDLGEKPRISQRTKKLTLQHWLKINPATRTIVEPDLEHITIESLE